MQVTPRSRSPTRTRTPAPGPTTPRSRSPTRAGRRSAGRSMETVTNPAPTTSGLDPDFDAHRQQPPLTVTGSGFVPRLDRAVGRHPHNHDLRLAHEIDGPAPGHRHGQLPRWARSPSTMPRQAVGRPARSSSTLSRRRPPSPPPTSPPARAPVAGATASVGGSGAGTAGSLSAAASGVGTVAVAPVQRGPGHDHPAHGRERLL